MHYSCPITVAFCFCAIVPIASGETIRWGFSPTDPAPYVVTEGNELGPSITRAIGELVANRLKSEVRFVEVPNNRLQQALLTGRIDIACNTMPAWHEAPGRHWWSQPLYRDADVVVTHVEAPTPERLADMQGMQVGTAHDQQYAAELLEAFRSGTLQRMDVRDTATRLRMIEHSRLDASVERRRAIRYHQQRHPENQLAVASWALSEMALRCAAGEHHRNIGKQAVEILDHLSDEQRISELLAGFE